MKTIPAIMLISLTLLIVACGKDKFETTPRLEIVDYSSKEIFPGDVLRIRVNYFDKEGDLDEAPFTSIIRRQNLFPAGIDLIDTFIYALPTFPPKDKGEITFQLPYGSLKESLVENDTLLFRFSVADREGHQSDTVISEIVVIHL